MKTLSVSMRRSTIIEEDSRVDIERVDDDELRLIIIRHGVRVSCTKIDKNAAVQISANLLLALSGQP
jgi:hypothetical protein